ncbi:diacylglycerol kinase [Cricetibacter osteomyelitidis]|uniref:Diacylglycerol kinase n=1 Tax=Cricetibacter osteomyelitidis TaxID=1521931 RepID=A0A4R2T2Q7_9PAST|nr:diacylglycerol kinase [Cricetibacter osteomyelitidis]TCP96245.1 diacylglycerol kinase [Cricetibacter osteomyelitidis]
MEKHTGIKHVFKAAQYSMQGLKAASKETAFQHELLLAVIMLPLAFWLGKSNVEIALLVGTALMVLVVELLNSAIESVVDRIGIERHELSGRAKDMGSAAVFVAMVICLLVWGIVIFL